MPGSAMPSFSYLPEKDRWALVSYIKSLAVVERDGRLLNLFERRKGEPVKVPPELAMTSQSIAKGKEVYEKLECAKCHGTLGRGDGPSAGELTDEWGFPTWPNNFTRGIYKGGSKNTDIYLRFITGMDGTPMPSFEGIVGEEENWALVHYVRSLAGSKVVVQPSTGTVLAKRVPESSLPLNPSDPLWDKVKATQIPLMLLWQRQEAVDSISIKALHNGKEIAFLIEWEDLEPAARFIRNQDYTDAAAIQFSLSSEHPHFAMGEKGKPINIWYWRADRQMDIAKFQDMEDVYPLMAADDYLFEKTRYPKTMEKASHLPVVSAPQHDPVYITGWGAGNPVSIPQRTSPVEDLDAEGFGTLTSQPKKDQNVNGQGFWVEGKWRVVFLRSMKDEGKFDVRLRPGSKVPIAFAVWDGSKGDRNGQKAVTTWHVFQIEK